jgi:secreted Zn-dependent insulinase-like peptidase
MCAVVVGPQPLDELEGLVRGSLAGVRPRGTGQPRCAPRCRRHRHAADYAPAAADADAVRADSPLLLPRLPLRRRPWDWPVCLPSDLGLLFKVAPQRELRQLELQWRLPYSRMRDARWAASLARRAAPLPGGWTPGPVHRPAPPPTEAPCGREEASDAKSVQLQG